MPPAFVLSQDQTLMFILTTAPRVSQTEIQKTQAFAITQRTLTTLLIETADKPRPLLRRHPASSDAAAHASLPTFPQCQMANPAADGFAVARGAVCNPLLPHRQPLSAPFFKYPS